jgi:hypothetical protein
MSVAPAVIGLSLIAMMFWVKQLYAEFGSVVASALFWLIGPIDSLLDGPSSMLLEQTHK